MFLIHLFYEKLCDEFPSDQKFDNFDFDKQKSIKNRKNFH